MKILISFIENESGATAIEYGLIAALVAFAAVLGFGTLGTSISEAYTEIGSDFCDEVTCVEED